MKKIFVYTDGGSRGNPGPAAGGFVVYDETGEKIGEGKKFFGVATNNVAEYSAVVIAVDWLVKNKLTSDRGKIIFHLDSQLVVNQLMGRYKIKNQNLQKIAIEIKQKTKDFSMAIEYQYIPREQNRFADRLVNQSLNEIG